MIGVILTFSYSDDFDEQVVRRIADSAHYRFKGMAGLRSKVFTVNPNKRKVINIYVWDSEEAAKAFFSLTQLNRIAAHYKAPMNMEFVQIAALVENQIE